MCVRLRHALLVPLLVVVFVWAWPLQAGADSAVWVVELRGPLGPATAEYIVDNLELAPSSAQAVVLLIDTPGGLDQAMRNVVRAILASPIPVLSYVEPNGARAASAGTYILFASHFAAMAPATNLGAATPVQIGMAGTQSPPADRPAASEPASAPGGDAGVPPGAGGAAPEQSDLPGDAMSRKLVNDAVAYLRALAELRGRNVEWAEQAVREGASLSASQALELGVIDAVSDDLGALLESAAAHEFLIEGRRVELSEPFRIDTKKPTWRQRLLTTITNPNIAYLLLLAGFYGLLLEFYNPGVLIPGISGAICLFLALYAFQILPINYAGLALVLFGIALIVAEAIAPGFGLLGIGGVIAFAVGSLMLVDSELAGMRIEPLLVLGATVATALFCVGVAAMALRVRRHPVVSGAESMVGMSAEALEDFEQCGHVRVAGEIWQAECQVPVARGQWRRVIAVDGLTVRLSNQMNEEGDS